MSHKRKKEEMQEIKIGRSSSNDIVINDSSVSRLHASIMIDGVSMFVVDHGSTNGTYINGLRIRGRHPLKNDDILKVGNSLVPWKHTISGKPKDSGIKNDVSPPETVQPPKPPAPNSYHPPYIPPKQTSSIPFIIIGVLALMLIVGGVVFSDIMPARWLKYMISPAKPTVVRNSKQEYSDFESFDYQKGVKAKIINNGSEGYVKIKTILYECDKTYTRETTIKIKSGDTYDHEVIFNEVELLNDCTYRSEIVATATF